MSKKTNGSGNGHDPDDKKIVKFPTLADRDRMRKEELRQEKQWQKQYKKDNKVPFLNVSKIPPFAGATCISLLLVQAVLYVFFDAGDRLAALYTFGFIPGYFTGSVDGMPLLAYASPLTHLFIHGGWTHLVFNAIMLLALGTFFERLFGPKMTAFFFFACGIAGALTFLIFNPFATFPLIGASGSISGLFGAVIVILFKQNKTGHLGKRNLLPLIVFWILFMFGAGMVGGGNIAWQSHIGGFLAGIGIVHMIYRGKIRIR